MAKSGDEKKEGVTVQQIENFGKHHSIEIFFTIVFILSSFFSFLFYGPGWSIYAAGIGAIVAVWIPKYVSKIAHGIFHFCANQQKITKIVIAVIGWVFSIFLPPLIFLCIGLMAGRSLHRKAIGCHKEHYGEDDHSH